MNSCLFSPTNYAYASFIFVIVYNLNNDKVNSLSLRCVVRIYLSLRNWYIDFKLLVYSAVELKQNRQCNHSFLFPITHIPITKLNIASSCNMCKPVDRL